MLDYALKLIIPISGPGTRRPCTGNEKALNALMGFCPEWYVENAGVRFGQKWHEDCLVRYESLVKMKKTLGERFPSIEDFQPYTNDLGWERDCATLNGVYGIKLIPMLYGQKIAFPDNDWPSDVTNVPLPLERLRAMKEIDLNNHPVMEALEGQMADMRRQFGRIEGYLNYQGVLNIALKLRGNDIFLDMVDDPDFADDLFAHIARTMDALARRVQGIQRQSGYDIDLISVSNCVVNMISPAMYERFILPWDQWLSKRFQRFGVHTCNWDVTPYLDSLSKIEKLGYLDMGFVSDLRAAREKAPNARRTVLYSPVMLNDKPEEALEKDVARIAAELAPCDIALADIMGCTPDQKINRFLSLVEKYRARLETEAEHQ